MPAIPHSAAGPRMEPPVSVPMPHRIMPEAPQRRSRSTIQQ